MLLFLLVRMWPSSGLKCVETNELVCWGSGELGQLGLNDTENVYTPEVIPFFEGKRVLNVACGVASTLVVVEE
jgi:alpha-tubulin suppressor-like RCC1 family protein